MGRAALVKLGFDKEVARQLSDDFLKFDAQLIEETWQHRGDVDTLVKKAADGRDFIKRTLNADRDRRGEQDFDDKTFNQESDSDGKPPV